MHNCRHVNKGGCIEAQVVLLYFKITMSKDSYMQMINAALSVFCLVLLSAPICFGMDYEGFDDLPFLRQDARQDIESTALLDSLMAYEDTLNAQSVMQAKSALVKAEEFLKENPNCHFKRDIQCFMAKVQKNLNKIVYNS